MLIDAHVGELAHRNDNSQAGNNALARQIRYIRYIHAHVPPSSDTMTVASSDRSTVGPSEILCLALK